MHSHEPREDPLTDLGYEVRDINVKGLGITALIFFAFSIACFVVVGIWFVIAKPQMSSELNPNKPMPQIQLQSDIAVRADIATFRQNETERLGSSGPNPDGSFHIPVDKALEVIASRGLPHVETTTRAVSPGNTIEVNAVGPGSRAAKGAMPAPSAPEAAAKPNPLLGSNLLKPAAPTGTGGPNGKP
jgi:hypothetical protein